MFRGLHADAGSLGHPLLEERFPVKTITLCVITSDTGLCGSYNHNLLKAAEAFMEEHKDCNIQLVAVGREAYSHFKEKGIILNSYLGLYGRYSETMVGALTKDLVNIFMTEEADEVRVAYTRFSPTLRHAATVEKFLNIEWETSREEDRIFEPAPKALFDAMLSAYLTARMRSMVLESFTAEHSARMFAMKTATDNASELIDTLTLLRNKARQFAITKEVLEIAMSAEALKE
jgi:F-type H+-transporting ATPase subunit gamma